MKHKLVVSLILANLSLAGCNSSDSETSEPSPSTPDKAQARNVIFFLGDGMGLTTLTASRIYAVGEDGKLSIDQLPETAFIKTFSNDSQVTDSAPSMSAYMTGVKMNNDVISMSTDTQPVRPTANQTSQCSPTKGKAVTTLLELAKKSGRSVGVVTTTRVTHATPAATYAHTCHRDAENDIAAQLVPGGAGYNPELGQGVDVIFGGGRQFFLPTAQGGKRNDGRDLTAELKAKGYSYAATPAEFAALKTEANSKALALLANSHLDYDLDRKDQPSLAAMTDKAIQILSSNQQGFFLMVEGGRIDHALHETLAQKALQDTKAFDDALSQALTSMRKIDPELKNTLIVLTADHDHTLLLNGYAKRTGKTTATNPGVLGLVHHYGDNSLALDLDGKPFGIIGFGNGENRPAGNRADFTDLTPAMLMDPAYHQEAVVPMGPGAETHGGTDVLLGAIGYGADQFYGFLDNTEVFAKIRQAADL